MPNIARKGRMGQNLNKMLKVFPKDYAYYPRTWVLPSELGNLPCGRYFFTCRLDDLNKLQLTFGKNLMRQGTLTEIKSI